MGREVVSFRSYLVPYADHDALNEHTAIASVTRKQCIHSRVR